MRNTNTISLKAFLVAAAFAVPFAADARGSRNDLNSINNDIGATLEQMRTDFDNQADNQTGTAPKGRYKANFTKQLNQLDSLLSQAKRGGGGGRVRGGRRSASANDLTIVPLVTNIIANLQRLGELDGLDQATRDDVKEYLENIDAGRDQRLQRQIDAAVAVL